MNEVLPWLLLDVGNTAIKWRLAHAEGLLIEVVELPRPAGLVRSTDWSEVVAGRANQRRGLLFRSRGGGKAFRSR